MLHGLVERVAQAGRLLKDVGTAAQVIHSAGCGVTLTLMQLPADQRDLSISVTCREAVLAALTTDAPASHEGPGSHAVALARLLPEHDERFSDAELPLLKEWLARLS